MNVSVHVHVNYGCYSAFCTHELIHTPIYVHVSANI